MLFFLLNYSSQKVDVLVFKNLLIIMKDILQYVQMFVLPGYSKKAQCFSINISINTKNNTINNINIYINVSININQHSCN